MAAWPQTVHSRFICFW